MAVITAAIALAGLAVAGAGAVMQYNASRAQASAQQQAIAAQQQAEAQRQQQMNLDAERRKREIIRQQTVARAQSLAVTTAQGAGTDGSSATAGAYGGISGRTNVNELGVNQAQESGNLIFGFNRQASNAYSQYAAAGSSLAFGQGLTSFGGALMTNANTIGKVGGFVQNWFTPNESGPAAYNRGSPIY